MHPHAGEEDGQIADGQVEYEVVGGLVHEAVEGDHEYDEHVAHERDEHDDHVEPNAQHVDRRRRGRNRPERRRRLAL